MKRFLIIFWHLFDHRLFISRLETDARNNNEENWKEKGSSRYEVFLAPRELFDTIRFFAVSSNARYKQKHKKTKAIRSLQLKPWS